MRNERKISTFTYTVKPLLYGHSLSTGRHLIITDSLLCPLGKESPYMDTFYDPLNVRDWYDCPNKNVVEINNFNKISDYFLLLLLLLLRSFADEV